MCFNATASFVMGSALVAIGITCVTMAYKANKKWLSLALIPLISGMQQITEGVIWLKLNAGNVDSAHAYSYLYLFVAYTFWTAYIPMCAYHLEPNTRRKKLFQGFIIAGLIISASIYLPILTGLVTFSTLIENHSIHYLIHVSSLTIWTYSILYAATIILSLTFSSIPGIRIFGLMIPISFLVTYWWYIYAFTSVWCFFAAISSTYILALIYKLPKESELRQGVKSELIE